MSNSTSGSGHGEANTSPLDQAPDATEEGKPATDDLAVVQAVLDTKIAQGANDDDLKRAVEETKNVEKRLGDSAE